jgi:hypothetical protein
MALVLKVLQNVPMSTVKLAVLVLIASTIVTLHFERLRHIYHIYGFSSLIC